MNAFLVLLFSCLALHVYCDTDCKSEAPLKCKFMCGSKYKNVRCQCGVDGKTYLNTCEMKCSGFMNGKIKILRAHNGPCSKDCEETEFGDFKQRFIEWFDLTEQNIAPKFYKRSKKVDSQEVLKMMYHSLDKDQNMVLSWNEVKYLADIPYEHCAAKFYRACDSNDDLAVEFEEWGRCFDQHLKLMPCEEEQLKAAAARASALGNNYFPSCSPGGYCLPKQCNTEECWCTNPACVRHPYSTQRYSPDFTCNGL